MSSLLFGFLALIGVPKKAALLSGRSAPQQYKVFLPAGTTSWTPPAGVTVLDSVEGIASGGGGGAGNTSTSGGAGGQGGPGGAYAKITNLAVTPGVAISCQVGTGPAGNTAAITVVLGQDTWFKSTTTLLAKAGSNGIAGGTTAASVGTTKFAGGNGAGSSTATGAGGGGSGGPDGAGANGSGTGTGGVGNNFSGKSTAAPASNSPGNNGTQFDATHGSGSGGSGGSTGNGLPGGSYGAGGGGGRLNTVNSFRPGGKGADGLIVITYTA